LNNITDSDEEVWAGSGLPENFPMTSDQFPVLSGRDQLEYCFHALAISDVSLQDTMIFPAKSDYFWRPESSTWGADCNTNEVFNTSII